MEKYNCEWTHCDGEATVHARFGFSATDEEPYVATHGNFCPKHIWMINGRFTAVNEGPIGDCPDGCK